MAVTKEQPFPEALADSAVGFQNGDSAGSRQSTLAIRKDAKDAKRVRKVRGT
jgi:hypothetical protein